MINSENTILNVPHEGKTIYFASQPIGPGIYANVNKQIKVKNLQIPSFAQTVSIFHAAWQPGKGYNEKLFSSIKKPYLPDHARKIVDMFEEKWFWGFSGILYVPDEGAYIQDQPSINEKDRIIMDRSNLIKKLEAKDPSVRFVPFGYKIGKQSSTDIAKNPFIIALAGEEGAEKLAEIADNYGGSPLIWGFEGVDDTLTRTSALSAQSGNWKGDRLYIDGDDAATVSARERYSGDGYAFGILPESK